MNLSTWLERWADQAPSRPAIRFEGCRISYAELDRGTRRLAAILKHRLDIGRGDRVAHLGYNSPDLIMLVFACARLGALLVPLNWRLAPPEHGFILDNAGAKALLFDAAFADTVRALLPRPLGGEGWGEGAAGGKSSAGQAPLTPILSPPAFGVSPKRLPPALSMKAREAGRGSSEAGRGSDEAGRGGNFIPICLDSTATGFIDLASLETHPGEDDSNPGIGYDLPLLIVYTSGTTGRPKGAVLRQEALLWNAVNSTVMHDLTGRDRVLTTLPMFHVGGLNIQTLPALHAGATVILHRRFEPTSCLAAIATERPTLTVLVPAQMTALLAEPGWPTADLSSLRLVTTGSSIVPRPLIEAFHHRDVPVIQVYGSTETAPIAIFLAAADARSQVGSTGKPAPHCEIRIVDEAGRDVPPGRPGEILVRGPNVMTEYWGDPAATAEALRDGWFHTGDIGHRDAEGFTWIDDRKKDVIISGGENIYPAELEAVLADLSGIAESAVIGRPDPRWGEVPLAVVVLRPGASLTAEAILAAFQGRLARFKHPRAVAFAEALPRNSIGKIQKHELRRLMTHAG